MAGTVSVSPGVLWSASSRLFYWVITDIAKRATDVGLAEHLNEIDRENLGWFGFGDITLSQRRGQLQHRHTAGGIIVRAVIDVVTIHRLSNAEMVHVGGKENDLIF